jgi:iron(III) transport system permease protein
MSQAAYTAPQSMTTNSSAGSIVERWSWDRLLWPLLAAIVFMMAVVPLLYIIDASFYGETRMGLSKTRDLTAVQNVYFGARYIGYLINALTLAAIVTALSLVAGVAMAVLIARTDIPFKGTLDLMIIMPLFLSPFTGLMAWIALGSERSGFINVALTALFGALGIDFPALVNIWTYAGIVWVMFLFFCPFVYLFTVGNMRAMDSSLEESARMSGATPMQTLMRITLPMSLPAIVASGLLIFIISSEMYTIPGIVGARSGFTTLPWQIYVDSTVFPVHRAHAAAAGTLLLWVTLFGVWLQRRITRQAERFVTISGKGFQGRPLSLGAGRWVALAGVGLYIFCAVVLPFGALLLSSFMKYSASALTWDLLTLSHYRQIFTVPDMRLAIQNTLLLAVMAGGACVIIGSLISIMEVRRPSAGTRLVAFLGVLPVAVPGIVYGVGLLWTYVGTPVYGTIWILFLAYGAMFLPYAIMVSRSAVLQIHPELEQSARISGATALVVIRKITMPLLKPTLIAILFFVMIMSMKELSASVLLYNQRLQVLSVLTWHYMDAGNYQFAAAIGVVQTSLMLAVVILTRAIFRVKLERALAK